MRYFFLIILLAFTSHISKAQSHLDSLYSIWIDNTQPDSIRVSAFSDYILNGFMYSQPDSAYILGEDLVSFSISRTYLKGQAIGLNLQGVSHDIRGNSSKAFDLYSRSLAISEKIGDKNRIGIALNNIGIIYEDKGNYTKALSYYEQSLEIHEKIGRKGGVARSLGNIGDIYKANSDFTKALEYYLRSLNIREEIGASTGSSLKDIGEVYFYQGDYSMSLEYYKRALTEYKNLGNMRGMAHTLGNIGEAFKEQGDYTKALDYNAQCLELLEETGDQPAIAQLLVNNGDLYLKLGSYTDALDYCKRGLVLAKSVDHLTSQNIACKCLYKTYKTLGNRDQALTFLEKSLDLDDSLQLEETAKQLQLMEFEKVMLRDSIAKVDEERIVQESHEKEVHQKNLTRNYLASAGVLLLFIAGGFYSRWRLVRKSRDAISKEKDQSDKLLLNILPAEVAAELKEKGKADARDYNQVSILFTDFIGFTEQSVKLSAAALVSEINVCFEEFDGIITKYNIEKIKTIGDAYMAAGGLPIPTDDSVRNTVLAALEMQEFINQRILENETHGKPAFKMRVGIHTGPVIAGIVGIKKFQYDIWGDAVNTANRIESNSKVGKVNISQSTYELINNDNQFTFESRGKIEVKGKGAIEMYFVYFKISK